MKKEIIRSLIICAILILVGIILAMIITKSLWGDNDGKANNNRCQ